MRLADIPVHDPWVVADVASRTYYLYTSGGPDRTGQNRFGTVAYRSRDLLNWDGPHVVFVIPDGVWANPMHGAWAPEVHQHNGRYWLLVTLHNRDRILAQPPDVWRVNHMRGTTIASADTLLGPFRLVKDDSPITPAGFMTLDGTLFIDENSKPWMVYCHEWIQIIDGAIEAIPLREDLSAAAGQPIHLFKGSDAPWLNEGLKPDLGQRYYVTDGPQLFRTKTGRLVMLWSSYAPSSLGGSYVQALARSESDRLQGPWRQLGTIVGQDSGHGMIFSTFEGQLMLVVHQPFQYPQSRARLYEIEDTGDGIRVVCARPDLYGAPT